MGDRAWKQEAKTNPSTKEVQGQRVFEYSAMVGSSERQLSRAPKESLVSAIDPKVPIELYCVSIALGHQMWQYIWERTTRKT